MLGRVSTVVLLTFLFATTCFAQSSPDSAGSQQSSSKDQQVDIKTPPNPVQPIEEQPAPQPTQEKKKSSKISRKIDEALPDCVNLIFYRGCRHSDARQQDADEREQQKLAEAAERCKQLTAALPAAVAAKLGETKAAEIDPNFSSSRQPQPPAPYCTPEDVIAADHDVDVGDFNFKDKNYRGAEMRYRSALERLPEEPIATLHLARVLEKLGNKAEAYDRYKVFLEWSPTGKDAEEANSAIARLQKQLALK
jgi:tetratricopeptide (TPR) repeat protein